MKASHLVRASLLASLGLYALCALACHVEGNVRASTDDEHPATRDQPEPTTAPAPASSPPAPTTPPTDACPLFCYEARGSVRSEMTAEEATQLRSSLEPVLGRMRTCTSADEWRRYGSPTINLRIAPDGTLAEMGVDPHHGGSSSCFENAGNNGGATLALPGRKVVRCSERCVRESPRRGAKRGR